MNTIYTGTPAALKTKIVFLSGDHCLEITGRKGQDWVEVNAVGCTPMIISGQAIAKAILAITEPVTKTNHNL